MEVRKIKMIFEIINNVIENILMSYFISSYLKMKEKNTSLFLVQC